MRNKIPVSKMFPELLFLHQILLKIVDINIDIIESTLINKYLYI